MVKQQLDLAYACGNCSQFIYKCLYFSEQIIERDGPAQGRPGQNGTCCLLHAKLRCLETRTERLQTGLKAGAEQKIGGVTAPVFV